MYQKKLPIIGINGMRIPDEEDELYIKDKTNIHYIGAVKLLQVIFTRKMCFFSFK